MSKLFSRFGKSPNSQATLASPRQGSVDSPRSPHPPAGQPKVILTSEASDAVTAPTSPGSPYRQSSMGTSLEDIPRRASLTAAQPPRSSPSTSPQPRPRLSSPSTIHVGRPIPPHSFSTLLSHYTPRSSQFITQASGLPSAPRSTRSSGVIQDASFSSHISDDPNPSRHKYETGEVALDTYCALSLEQVVTEIESVSGMGDLVGCLTLIFQAIELSRVNKNQWRLLRGRCIMVLRIAVAQTVGREDYDDSGLERVTSLLRDTFDEIIAQAQRYSGMNQGTEFFQFEAVSEQIKRLFSILDSCLNTLFSYEMDVAQSQWIDEFHPVQKAELAKLNRIRQDFLDKNQDLKRSMANQAKSASKRAENLSSKGMSAREMFECLMRHGCRDLTNEVNMKTISEHAVATGAYGDIWKGKLDDSTVIAIKVWSFRRFDEAPQKCLKGAMRELYNWSKADHNNIQKLLGVIMFGDRLGMVSEWMENGNLQDYLRQHEPADRYQLSIQVAKAVQHLHREGMVHGDIKACNFLVSSDGVVKLTDFDHSIISCHSIVFSQTTTLGGGTMRWMAPELVMDEGEVELRSTQADVYALGMTILETITGAPPYAECHSDAQIFCKLSDKVLPERAENLQNARGELLWRLLTECWDHDPTMRPSADHVVDQLQLLTHTTLPLSDDSQE